MKALKTLIIITDFTLGGIQNYVRATADLLDEMNHKVFIIAINNAIKYKDIETISLKNYTSYKKPIFIKRFIKKNEIDLILDHRTKSNIIKQKVYDILLKKTPKIQFIHSANFSLYFYKYKWLNQFVYKNTDVFVSVSKYINELVKEQINTEYEVLYHFLELTRYDNLQSQKKDILFVGRFEDNVKDLTFLLNAYQMSNLHSQNVLFHFVGDGNDKNLIKQFAKENDLENYIIVHSPVNDLTRFYQNAKVVILASFFEGFPLVLMEALHNGTPVLTTEFNASVHELIIHNKNGIIVEKSLNIFATSLQKIFNEEIFYKQLLSNIDDCNNNFSKKNALKKWEDIFNKSFKNRSA